jgi:hypothetical protein
MLVDLVGMFVIMCLGLIVIEFVGAMIVAIVYYIKR